MEIFCYKHKNVKASINCHYCGKAYCKDCLRLHGKRKIVICEDCFDVFEKRLEKSIIRRKVYAVIGGLITLPIFYTGYESYIMEDSSSSLFFILGVACLISTLTNIIRIKQSREFLVHEEYQG